MNKRILASIVSLSAVCAVGVGLVCVSPWKSSISGENAQKEPLNTPLSTENLLDISGRLADNESMADEANAAAYSLNDNEEITKKSIFFKMLNTIDYFDTAEGSIEICNEGDMKTSEFACNLLTADAYEYSIRGNEIHEYYSSSNGEFYEVFKERKLINKGLGSCNIEEAVPIPDSERITVAEDGINCYAYRADPTNTPTAREGLQPQELTFNFMTVEDNWDITGETIFLGRDCVVIEGSTNDYAEEKLGVYTFKFTVDKETGVLMKYDGFDADGNIISYSKFNELNFNSNPEIKKYNPDKYTDYEIIDKSHPKHE